MCARILLMVGWLVFVTASILGAFAEDGGSAGPMPLVDLSVMTAIKLAGQAVVIALLLTFPGLALLRRLNGGCLPPWPNALMTGLASLLSLVLVSATTLLLVHTVGCAWAPLLFMTGVVVTAFLSRRAAIEFAARLLSNKGRGAIVMLALAPIMYLSLAAMMAATPYPAIHDEGLLDMPVFSRVAANFVEEGALAEDYFHTELITGKLEYPATMTIVPVTVTAACFWLFGQNAHSFFVIHLFLGMLMLAVAASIALRDTRTDTPGRMAVFLLLAAVPAIYFPVAMGSNGTLLALAALVLVGLSQQDKDSRALRTTGVLLVLIALPIMRPEGLLLGAAMIVFWLGRALLGVRPRFQGVALLAMAGILAFVGYCWVLNRFPKAGRHSSLLTQRYDPASGQFRSTQIPWYERNCNRADALLSGAPRKVFVNASLGEEVLSHPIAYARRVAQHARASLYATGLDLSRHQPGGMALLIPLIGIAMCRREHGVFVAAMMGYLILLAMVNEAAGARHRLCVVAVLATLAIRTGALWLQSFTMSTPRVRLALITACLIVAPLLALNTRKVYWNRLTRENHLYTPIVNDLFRLDDHPRSIATNYPYLISCLTGAWSVGDPRLIENLDGLVKRYSPEWILIDNGPMGKSYDAYQARAHPLTDYTVAIHNQTRGYMLLRRGDRFPIGPVSGILHSQVP
ncbi:MAG: hypothetical protein ACE5EQ_04380 [Phycisphaerae bacterium]